MKKNIFLIAIITIFAINLFADCRLMIISSINKTVLNQPQTYNRLNLFRVLNELEIQGGSSSSFPNNNTDGWGLVSYTSDSEHTAGIYKGAEPAYGSQEFENAKSAIIDNTNNLHLVIGHVRKSTSGPEGIEDPHPFTIRLNGIDYSFAHNGGIDKFYLKNKLIALDSLWLENHPPNTYGHGDWHDENVFSNNVVDSQMYFLWIMLNIEKVNGNIYEGLHNALYQLGNLPSGENWNFVFTDGIDIYAFRDSDTERIDHNLKYTWNSDWNNWVVMSTMPSTLSSESHMVPNNSLLYLSATGHAVLFKNFTFETPLHCRVLSAGFNWEAFPVFPTNTYAGTVILDQLIPYGVGKVIDQNNSGWHYSFTNGWDPFYFGLNDSTFYKIQVTTDTPEIYINNGNDAFYTEGILREPELPLITNAVAGKTYWIGYTILPSQNIKDAFGENWSKIDKVWAQDWYYDSQHYERGLTDPIVPSNSTSGKTMEFAKGYIVKFIEDVHNFKWHYPHTPADDGLIKKTKFFTYNETSTYEVKDVMSVDTDEEISEIGVFQDGVCKGAAVVDKLPVQILAYTDPNGGDLSFQVATKSKSTANFKTYSILDWKTNSYHRGSLTPRTQFHSVIKLGKNDFETVEIVNKPELFQNYPNPFNPTTTISFNLKKASRVKLEVFNIKGQRVKTLRDANLTSGKYSVSWAGKDDQGHSVSSGIYFYKLIIDKETQTKRMILLK